MLSRINKAVGGKAGRMPHFFQYSRNGRKGVYVRKEEKKKFAKPNGSTMNRICRRFDGIGNINLNYAGVPPFNWQMLLVKPCCGLNPAVVKLFCDLDDANISNVMESRSYSDLGDKDDVLGYDLLRDIIVEEIEKLCGSLENAYPYIVKHLFAGEGMDKPSHKQMFWRVFGDIALRNLKQNLSDYRVCEVCGMKYPLWVANHYCVKTGRGFYECVDCGALCQRTHSMQSRCEECQQEYFLLKRRKYSSHVYDKSRKKVAFIQD